MKAIVCNNEILAGYLEKDPAGSYRFIYDTIYLENKALPPISLTLPKSKNHHESATLFAFFDGLLSEGVNKEIQCRLLKMDESDDFARLLNTAGNDTIGAITVKIIAE